MFNTTVTRDRHVKTLAKTIAYRICSFLTTILLTLILGGNLQQALTMGGVVVTVGLLHYYLYDRLWLYIGWKRNSAGDDSTMRSLVKSIIYRITALLVTALMARVIFADSNLIAVFLATIKFIVNLAIYYSVERVFNWIKWGREH